MNDFSSKLGTGAGAVRVGDRTSPVGGFPDPDELVVTRQPLSALCEAVPRPSEVNLAGEII